MSSTCSIPDCDRRSRARGLCYKHWRQWRATVSFGPGNVASRLEAKTDRTGSCWVWLGSTTRFGYGQVYVDGKMRLAHRVAYELDQGPIPVGKELDHLCRNRQCIKPAHLEPVSAIENMRRGRVGKWNAEKTQCPQGHPYDEANTQHKSGNRRACRACAREAARQRRQRQ